MSMKSIERQYGEKRFRNRMSHLKSEKVSNIKGIRSMVQCIHAKNNAVNPFHDHSIAGKNEKISTKN